MPVSPFDLDMEGFETDWASFRKEQPSADTLSGMIDRLYTIALQIRHKDSQYDPESHTYWAEKLTQFEKKLIQHIPHISSTRLIKCVSIFGRMRVQPSRKFLQAWETRTIKVMDGFSCGDLTDVFFQMAKLRCWASSETMSLLENKYREKMTKKLVKEASASYVIWALLAKAAAEGKKTPSDLETDLMEFIEKNILARVPTVIVRPLQFITGYRNTYESAKAIHNRYLK